MIPRRFPDSGICPPYFTIVSFATGASAPTTKLIISGGACPIVSLSSLPGGMVYSNGRTKVPATEAFVDGLADGFVDALPAGLIDGALDADGVGADGDSTTAGEAVETPFTDGAGCELVGAAAAQAVTSTNTGRRRWIRRIHLSSNRIDASSASAVGMNPAGRGKRDVPSVLAFE
ncbi:MAG: hypothetical protein ABIP77_05175 [Candidatus Limnocylindrales bacterium]